jgi:hypothetical protein
VVLAIVIVAVVILGCFLATWLEDKKVMDDLHDRGLW